MNELVDEFRQGDGLEGDNEKTTTLLMNVLGQYSAQVNTPVINGRAKEKHCLLVGLKPTSKQTIKTPSLREGPSRIKKNWNGTIILEVYPY